MKFLISFLVVVGLSLLTPSFVFAAASSDVTNYASDTLKIIVSIAAIAATFFIVKGGYLYFSSTGKPDALDEAKKTIKNAIIGLIIVLAAGFIVSTFRGALNGTASGGSESTINLTPITTTKPSDGLTQVLIDAVDGFMQNIVESSTKPIVDGILTFLTTTPSLLQNQVIFNFWLVMLGIVDSLFVVVVALLGLHFMSASTFGFDEVELKRLLPRIGLGFLGANISLFLADYVIVTCNALVKGVLNSTGGLNHAWITNAVSLEGIVSGTTPLITLIFLIIFLVVSIVLLLMYISRLIMISLGGVLSPFIFLLWTIPKFADFAEICIKTYIVSVFVIFVHVVVIQLASSFLSLPDHTTNPLVSIAAAIALFFTLLKIPQGMMSLVFYTTGHGVLRKLGSQVMNIMTSSSKSGGSTGSPEPAPVKVPRRTVQA